MLSLPVSFAADLSVNPLINTATADDSADPDGAQAQDSDALAALSGLSLTKDDGAASYVPGGTATLPVPSPGRHSLPDEATRASSSAVSIGSGFSGSALLPGSPGLHGPRHRRMLIVTV